MDTQTTSTGSKVLGIISLILGIASLGLCWSMWISFICAVASIAVGALTLFRERGFASEGKGLAKAGIIVSLFGLVASLVFFFITVVMVDKVNDKINDGGRLSPYVNEMKETLDL